MSLPVISPAEAQRLVSQGARLVDIRSPEEFAKACAAGAENRPLDRLGTLGPQKPVVFMCFSGMRTGNNADQLAASCQGEGYILDGGLQAWREARLPVNESPAT